MPVNNRTAFERVPAMPQHLTPEEREVISQMWFADHPQSEIARKLRRHRSTISRELSRNGSGGEYCGVAAQHKTDRQLAAKVSEHFTTAPANKSVAPKKTAKAMPGKRPKKTGK